MKTTSEIIDGIEATVMDLERDEKRTVRQLLIEHSEDQKKAADEVSKYLSSVLPLGVTAGLIESLF